MTRLEERDAIAILHDAGISPGSAWGLTWRLAMVDGMSDPEISEKLHIKPGTVRAYLSKVNDQLREQQYAGDLPETGAAEEPADAEAVAEAERALESPKGGHLIDAFRNRREHPDHGPEITLREPVVCPENLGDEPPYLPIPPTPGGNRKWREYLRGGSKRMDQ